MYDFGNKMDAEFSNCNSGLPAQAQCPTDHLTGHPPCVEAGVLLVADDLTGACDSGLAFVNHGFTASMQISAGRLRPEPGTDVVAISAETRNLPPEKAGARMGELAALHRRDGALLFHKSDSAGRGNPGEEMLALARVNGCDTLLYTPAFPSAGRVVRNGHLTVSDFSGQTSTLDLRQLIPASARERICVVPTGSEAELRRILLEASGAGRNIWLCDADTEQDLAQLVRAAFGLQQHLFPLQRLLWSGSAGLAAAVAAAVAGERVAHATPLPFPSVQGRVLIVCGTPHPVTSLQMRKLILRATPLSMASTLDLPAFDCGVLSVNLADCQPERFRRFWQKLHDAGHPPVVSLVLTGGDTAAFVLASLGTERLQLGGEVEPGIPWSVVRGGQADGCVVITKSGGFGTEESLVNLAGYCQRMQR
jgi:uncharacterized protein YgbK (DUF1537 family)